MKCLRCGYCCINYSVVIVGNPELGIQEDNLIFKTSGTPCKHLSFINEKAICTIHNYPWYKETPCFEYTQIGGDECRIGLRELNLAKTDGRWD